MLEIMPKLQNVSNYIVDVTTTCNLTGNDDYVLKRSPIVVKIPAGETHVKFNISIKDDSFREGNEKFDLIIINTLVEGSKQGDPGFKRGVPGRTKVTILDDDVG